MRRRVSLLETYCETASRAHSPPPSGISSMKRTCHSRLCVSRASSTTSSSLYPRVTTTLSLIGRRPTASAASMPAQISSTVPKRISRCSRPGCSVSMWMLTRRKPALAKRARQTRQQDAVGGHRQIAQAGEATEPFDDFDQVRPQRRLAAGESDLAKAHRARGACHALDLGRRTAAHRSAQTAVRSAACSRRSAGCSGRSTTGAGSRWCARTHLAAWLMLRDRQQLSQATRARVNECGHRPHPHASLRSRSSLATSRTPGRPRPR